MAHSALFNYVFVALNFFNFFFLKAEVQLPNYGIQLLSITRVLAKVCYGWPLVIPYYHVKYMLYVRSSC
jgi:hypothetical protein